MIELLFPPQWAPTQPYLGLACLAGYLQEKGIEVHQTDVNVLLYDHLLTKSFLEGCAEIVAQKYEKAQRSTQDMKKHREVHTYPLSLSLFSSNLPYSHKSSAQVLAAVSDSENFFVPLYEQVVPQILKNPPSVCGISITGVNQIIPGLTLAHYIKKRDPSLFVVLGGSVVTRWKGCAGLKHVFEVCDAVIIKEGEEALAKLYEEPLKKVPNIGYLHQGKLNFNPVEGVSDLDKLPTPCFQGLDLGLYFSPLPVLPVYASRACYWGKCAFCDHGYGYNREYRVRSPQNVVQDLIVLKKQHNTCFFSFADEAIPPSYFRTLCSQVIESGLHIRWFAHVRAENGFNQQLCKHMYAAGCRMLLFGIESGSQKILNLMDKGTDTGTTRKILKICRNAGIWNHVFLFFGFPGEEKTDAEETINFLCNNREVINSVGCSTFLPGKHSRVCHEKQFASLIEICKDKEEDMAIWHDYQAKKGITPEEAINMRKKLKKKSQCLHPHQFILESICREHLLPLIDHGLTFKAAEKVPAVTKASTPFLSPTVGLKIVEEDVISLIDGISCIEGDEKLPSKYFICVMEKIL